MIEIRSPQTTDEWQAYYAMRYRVMREPLGQPLGSERNEGDATGIHFALYEDHELRAIARLDQAEKGVSQVRFVAVDSLIQGKGYGKQIMLAVEEYSKNAGNSKMILHARDYAVKFYLKLGYTLIGESYKLFGTLQHYLMEKTY